MHRRDFERGEWYLHIHWRRRSRDEENNESSTSSNSTIKSFILPPESWVDLSWSLSSALFEDYWEPIVVILPWILFLRNLEFVSEPDVTIFRANSLTS